MGLMRELVIRPVIEEGGFVRECNYGDTPHMFGVYEKGIDGLSLWVADFLNEKDAEIFVNAANNA